MWKNGLKTKLVVSFSLITLVAILITGSSAILGTTRALRQEIQDKVLLFADDQEGQILAYATRLRVETTSFSLDAFIRGNLREINSSNSAKLKSDLGAYLVKNKKSIDANLLGINILNLDGKIVASTEASEVGGDESADDYFIKGKQNAYLSMLSGHEHFGVTDVFAVGVPITDEKTGGTIGVITSFFGFKQIKSILAGEFQLLHGAQTSNSERGRNISRYFIGQDGKVLFGLSVGGDRTVSRINTLPVQECLHNNKETLGVQYLNHFGEPVIGVSMCLPDVGAVLLTEINVEIALGSVYNLGYSLVIMLALVFIFIIIEIYFISSNIVRPVIELRKASGALAQGNLDSRVDVKTGDEIEQLASAFNEMADSLRGSRAEILKYVGQLEEKVAEKTKDLRVRVDDLDKIREAVLNVAEDAENSRRVIAREKDKIDAILHSIGDGVFVVDQNMKVIVVNEVAAKMAGYEMEEILGAKYTDKLKFIFEETGEVNSQFIDRAIATKTVQEMANHTVLIDRSGNKVQVADSAAPLIDSNGGVVGCVVVFRDVGKERAVDKAKTEFVSLASHQLSTPLSAISWYVEMLMGGEAGKLTARQKKYLTEIQNGSKHMVELVGAFLNVSRLDLGTFSVEPEPIDVAALVESALNEQKPQIAGKKIKVSFESEKNIPKINADPKLLRIVFQNLISNAVKYTPESGKIGLVLSKNDQTQSVLFKITDTGYGIPKNQQSRIFTKLFRADNARALVSGGTGLGLYLVKSILDNTGGRIWFESEENKGTTFYVELPLAGMVKKEGFKSLS